MRGAASDEGQAPAPGASGGRREDPARSRRAFFLSVPSEIAAAWRDLLGVKQLRYSDLAAAPDDVLGRIRPVATSGAFSHREGRLVRQHAATGALLDSCDMDDREYAVFSRFSGEQTLAQVASWAAERYGLAPGEAFRLARGIFLRLLERKACRPANR